MDEAERIALEKSIKKWALIRDGKNIDERARNCPLCKLHAEHFCSGCIINDTEHDGCACTPYDDWWIHHVKRHGVTKFGNEPMVNECDECTRIASEEVEFLKSLRTAP